MSRRTGGRVRRIAEGPRLRGAALLPPGAAGTLQPSWRRQWEQLVLKERRPALGLLRRGAGRTRGIAQGPPSPTLRAHRCLIFPGIVPSAGSWRLSRGQLEGVWNAVCCGTFGNGAAFPALRWGELEVTTESTRGKSVLF